MKQSNYKKIKCQNCGYFFVYSLLWKCPVCGSGNLELLFNDTYINIFLKLKEIDELKNNKISGFLFHKNKHAMRWIKTKYQIAFYNKDVIIEKEIECLKSIFILKNYILLNSREADNIELAKIAFSLGLDISQKKEKEKIIKYTADKFGLPFKGYYVKIM